MLLLLTLTALLSAEAFRWTRGVFHLPVLATTRTDDASSLSSYSNIPETLKKMYQDRRYSQGLVLLSGAIEKGYVMTRQDVELACALAWEDKASSSALEILTVASKTKVDVSRQAIYSAMKAFCFDERYDDILHVLETLFPKNHFPDPFLPADRIKWRCRVFCEQHRPELALEMVKKELSHHSETAILLPALRTVMQTCSKHKQSREVLDAYELYLEVRAQGSESHGVDSHLLGNDLLSVFRAARFLNYHSLACDVLFQWLSISKTPGDNDIIPSAIQFCQGILSATSVNNFTAAHEFIKYLHLTGSENTSSLAVEIVSNNLLQNGIKGFRNSVEIIRGLGVYLKPELFTLRLASKKMNATSQLMMLEAMLDADIAPEDKAVSIVLQSCYKKNLNAAAIKTMSRLRSSGYPLNQYHYSIMVKIYGETRRPYEALAVLREAQKMGVPVDLRFYTTVISALGSQVNSKRNRVSAAAESSEIALANICYKLLDEALTSFTLYNGSRSENAVVNDASEVLTIFHTAMKPACRLGDCDTVGLLMRGLKQMNIPYDNITMSCILQAYTTAGRLLDARTIFNRFISDGMRPNGIVACIIVGALSNLGRYYESWLFFVDYCQKINIPVVVKHSDGNVVPFTALSHSDYYSSGECNAIVSFEILSCFRSSGGFDDNNSASEAG